MFIQIEEPSEIPVPPEEVRFRQLAVDPYPDGGRVRFTFDITPFQSGPNLEVEVYDQDEREVAALVVVGAHTNELSLTAHLRPRDPNGEYDMRARLSYEELGQVDELEYHFTVNTGDGSPDG
ncbi:MAG: hypothetical protein ACK2T2_00395 [Anaerolineales bacterium]